MGFGRNLAAHPSGPLCCQSLLTPACSAPSRRAYTASLGETAVAFDFGPQVPVPKHVLGQRGREEVLGYPLYILYENGETFLTYISLLQRYGLTRRAHGLLVQCWGERVSFRLGWDSVSDAGLIATCSVSVAVLIDWNPKTVCCPFSSRHHGCSFHCSDCTVHYLPSAI